MMPKSLNRDAYLAKLNALGFDVSGESNRSFSFRSVVRLRGGWKALQQSGCPRPYPLQDLAVFGNRAQGSRDHPHLNGSAVGCGRRQHLGVLIQPQPVEAVIELQ